MASAFLAILLFVLGLFIIYVARQCFILLALAILFVYLLKARLSLDLKWNSYQHSNGICWNEACQYICTYRHGLREALQSPVIECG
jgi:hypothetical protein